MTLRWIISNKLVHRRLYNLTKACNGELEVYRLVKSLHGHTFIDIGSNKGFYSEVARKNFKKVVSIDPNPRWDGLKFAVSNKRGMAMFHFGDSMGSGDSLLVNPHILGQDWGNDAHGILVETLTFDDLGYNADLVKIDVEGAEFEVIEGMNKFLPKAIIVELHDERRWNDLLKLMFSKGYYVQKIDDSHLYGRLRQ